LPRSERCENTALLADVVHHEFGHSLHFNSLTAGVGDFDSAASEALSDFLALSMSEDPALGLGFFVTRPDIAVRNLDPAYIEKRAPDDLVDEPHADGEILVGALWDMRKALIARLGKEAGTARALKIFYGIMQRGIGIFTSYNEALVADDDNGNLADGTPNQCAITTAFAHHGLTGGQPLALPTAPPPTRNGFVVETTLTPGGAAAGCANAKVVDGEVSWKIRGKTGDGSQGTLPITATANGTMASATLPTQPAGTVLQYQMRIALDDGTTLRFPDNAADPFYEFYVGDAKPIWCAEFEGADAPAVTMTGDWMTGKPMGPGAGNVGGDPAAAFGGTGVLGNNLQGGGLHAPGATAIATLPSVALAGYRNVRLQFRRWLNVDDASFDQASVRINGAAAFANPARNATSELEKFLVAPRVFRDREWREVDFDLGDPASGLDTSKISLELKSDSSNELGGWNVDHLCIVGVASVCGDGIVDATEACDDGNTLDDEQCMATCQLPTQADGGCCSATGSGATGPALLAFATLGFVGLSARRRRQR
jgi:cysteine-rich repeat protein